MLTCVQAGGCWCWLVQWPGWCCCAALCTTQPAHYSQGTLHCCPHHCSDAVQTINFTIMILHGTHCCTAWSGLCLLVTLVTSAVVESVEAQRPPLPAWQHQCQCGGGEHRPPLATSPPPARPSCEKYKDVSQREINDIGGRGRAALGYMLLCSASGPRHNTGRGRGGGGGGRGDKHVGGGTASLHMATAGCSPWTHYTALHHFALPEYHVTLSIHPSARTRFCWPAAPENSDYVFWVYCANSAAQAAQASCCSSSRPK